MRTVQLLILVSADFKNNLPDEPSSLFFLQFELENGSIPESWYCIMVDFLKQSLTIVDDYLKLSQTQNLKLTSIQLKSSLTAVWFDNIMTLLHHPTSQRRNTTIATVR